MYLCGDLCGSEAVGDRDRLALMLTTCQACRFWRWFERRIYLFASMLTVCHSVALGSLKRRAQRENENRALLIVRDTNKMRHTELWACETETDSY